MTKITNTAWAPYPDLNRFFRLKDGALREVTLIVADQPPSDEDEGVDAYYNASFGSGELSLDELDRVVAELSGESQ